MCTGFEIIPAIFGGGAAGSAAAGAGLGLFGEAAGASLFSGGFGAAAAGAGAAAAGAAELGLFGEAAGSSLFNGGFGAAAGAGAGAELGLFGEAAGSSLFGPGAGAELGLFGEGIAESLIPASSAFSSPLTMLQGLSSAVKPYTPYLNAASGVKGLLDAQEMKRQARLAAMRADPWGQSGGRGLADAQLQELMRDPSAMAASDPAFKLRIQGAQRANAQYGQDSGAMSIAGANASTDWYNARLAQLGGLAGSSVSPNAGAGVQMQGLQAASDLSSAALGSLGYAAGQGRGGLTPAQQQRLLSMAIGA